MRWSIVAVMLVAGCVPAGGGGGGDAAVMTPRDVGVMLGDVAVVDAGGDSAVEGDGGAVDGGADAADVDRGGAGDMAPPVTACSNGVDDDGDGRVDLADRGCRDAADDDESDEVPLPGCDDGEDNDGDGRVDLEDSDCTSSADPREEGVDALTACFNGLDDDGDGWVDFPFDPGCSAAGDDDEAGAGACANGVDDDGDGLADWPVDPGCQGAGDVDEADPVYAPGCADGVDGDEDGAVDGDDPGCMGAGSSGEAGPCVTEAIDLAAAGGRYVGTTAGLAGRALGSCGGQAGGEVFFVYTPSEPLERLVFSTANPGTARPTVLYLRRNCALSGDVMCDRGTAPAPGVELVVDEPRRGPWYVVVDTGSPEAGAFELTVDAVPIPACRNGRDDDGDGAVDAADPGCAEAEDRDEVDPAEPPACSNGLDDDGDGAIDYPADADCAYAGGVREAPLCEAGVTVVQVPAGGGVVPLPALEGAGGATGSCGVGFTPEVALAIRLDRAADVTVEARVGADRAEVTRFARRVCADAATEFACRRADDVSPLELLEQPAGELFVFVEQGFAAVGEERVAEVTIVPLLGECNDGVDNDGDGAVDLADRGCEGLRDQSEADPAAVPACDNGLDDDGDGLIDWPDDDSCVAAGDRNEGGCEGHPQWRPVECATGTWVWSSDRAFLDLASANANRALWTGCTHAGDAQNIDGLCSLDGTGWVSTEVTVMAGCNAGWYHIGGRHTGNCGGHDGDAVRRLVLGEDDCYDY